MSQKLVADELIEAAQRATGLQRFDSESFREALRRALESAGHVVVTAASGEEGLQAAASHRPDAIVVDGTLPGIDGATVVRRLRLDAALRDIPCLLLTASGVHIPFATVVRQYFIGIFLNNFLPSTVGGDVAKSPEQCAAIRFICQPGFQAFFDDCGCGCELVREQQEQGAPPK